MELIPDDIDFESYIDQEERAKVKSAADFMHEVIDRYHSPIKYHGLTLPWNKTHENVRIRHGEVTLWPGINGHGKSMVVGQVAMHMMANNEKFCIASFEMKPVATLARMCRQSLGAESPTVEYIKRFHEWSDGKLWMYDQQGTIQSSRVIGLIHYCSKQLGVTQFVIDSLMKCGINEDDYNGQKRFLDQLCAAAKDTGCHIHLIAHSRKGQDELTAPNKMDVKGSGSITDQVDNVITVWRNKRKEQAIAANKTTPDILDMPDALLIVDKQRHGEWEGKIGLYFDKPSFRYVEHDGAKTWPLLK